jgi:FkbM family methyltransferase
MQLRLRQIAVDGFYRALRARRVPPSLLKAASVLTDRTYLHAFLDVLKVDLVIDVGANNGGFATTLRRLGYAGRICSIEPNPDCFRALQKRFSSDPAWSGLNVALGARTERKSLGVPRLSNLGSFLTPIRFTNERTIEVEIQTLDSLFSDLVGDPGRTRVFLKTDTQGYDIEVLRGAGQSLPRIVAVQCEVSVDPVYDGIPHYLEVLSYLESLGFDLINLCTAARNRRNLRIIEYDCLMARRGEFS